MFVGMNVCWFETLFFFFFFFLRFLGKSEKEKEEEKKRLKKKALLGAFCKIFFLECVLVLR